MHNLRWAVIGASQIAANRVVPAIRSVGDEIVIAQSTSNEYGSAWALRQGIEMFTTDLKQAVYRDDVDAVYISSLNSLHASQAIEAASAGKHVLVEKPMATSIPDAQSMIDACKTAGVVLAVNHHLPASDIYQAMRELLRDPKEVGDIQALRVHHSVQLSGTLGAGWRTTDRRNGGVILDLLTHDAAVIDFLLNCRCVSVSAHAMRQRNPKSRSEEFGPEDAVVVAAEWAGGVLVEVHAAYNSGHLLTDTQVLGSSGSLVGTNCNGGIPAGGLARWRNGEHVDIPITTRSDPYETTIERFREAIRGQGVPIIDGFAGQRAVAFAICVKDSIDRRTVVEL